MAKSATTALYSEFRRESGGVLHVYQYLVVPSTINLIDDSVTPLVSMYRQLTAAHPRRPWTTHNAEVAEGETLSPREIDAAVKYAKPLAARTFDLLDSISRGGWELHKTLLAVELSTTDVEEVINEGVTPNALIRRILRARDVAGFGDLIPGAATSPSAPATATF